MKGYAAHESQTFQDVVDARAKATQMTLNVEDLTEENLRKYQAAQSELSKGLGKLMAIAESYPDLKASQNFSELQAQLEGTENRIAESRRLYNNAVKEYNVSVRRFPKNIVAGICGFDKKAPFEASEAAQSAPTYIQPLYPQNPTVHNSLPTDHSHPHPTDTKGLLCQHL